jgi:hypothetical protein
MLMATDLKVTATWSSCDTAESNKIMDLYKEGIERTVPGCAKCLSCGGNRVEEWCGKPAAM